MCRELKVFSRKEETTNGVKGRSEMQTKECWTWCRLH
jgi:hypothetical protein